MAPTQDVADYLASQLFLVAGNGEIAAVIAEGTRLLTDRPHLLALIAADRDAVALTAKQRRHDTARWHLEQTPPLPLREPAAPTAAPALTLATGRPRTTDETVFFYLLLRGAFGGELSDRQVWSLLADSLTLHARLADAHDRLPQRSTILGILNRLSVATVTAIHRALLDQARTEHLDDFAVVVADSTASAANSRFPTDSGLILRLLTRVFARWQALAAQGLPACPRGHLPRWHQQLKRQSQTIDYARRAGKRRSAYRQFLATAGQLLTGLGDAYDRHAPASERHCAALPPRAAATASRQWQAILLDLAEADQLCSVARARVLAGHPGEPDRLWSLSDPDARLIVKGGRDTVFGYRPTVVRSQAGLLTALCLEVGNPADSTLVLDALAAHRAATGVQPRAASFDDGYANTAAAQQAARAGTLISVAGSKGKRQTAPADWERVEYRDLRRLRPQIEATIGTLKARHGWRRLSRRGLPAVHRTLLEGMIAYNLLKLRRLRQQAARAPAAA